LRTYIRYFLFLICTILLGPQGRASSSEGVYIAEKETVFFFSDAFQIINLVSDYKISTPLKKIINKESKSVEKSYSKIQFFGIKKSKKNIDIKIPVKHLLFNVKKLKKSNIGILKSKDTYSIFFKSIHLNPFLFIQSIKYIGIDFIHLVKSQWHILVLYCYRIELIYLKVSYAFLGLFLGLLFYVKISEKAKNIVYLLRRGPPNILSI
jgi:hypothetical protein